MCRLLDHRISIEKTALIVTNIEIFGNLLTIYPRGGGTRRIGDPKKYMTDLLTQKNTERANFQPKKYVCQVEKDCDWSKDNVIKDGNKCLPHMLKQLYLLR